MYHGDDYDLAGFSVGIVEKSDIIDGSLVKPGDVIIALASSGVHSNGYSLVRKVIEVSNSSLQQSFGDSTLGETLLVPTRIYVKSILSLVSKIKVHALAHITGGGLIENIPRVLPDNCQAALDESSWEWPAIFTWLQKQGHIKDRDMYLTFNCGIGMVAIVAAEDADDAIQYLQRQGEQVWQVGTVKARAHDAPAVTIG
jgi:phosphoribosylformylglycinamidine cyclo-ligase